MFRTLLDRVKHPVTFLREKSAREPVRRATLYGIITLGIFALLNIGTIIRVLMTQYSKEDEEYERCSRVELWRMRWNAFRKRELT